MSVRDRLFAPAPHLNRNIFSQLPVDSDVPANVAGDLDSGWPWCLADLVPYSPMYLAAVQRFSIFVFSQLAKHFHLKGWATTSGAYLSVLSFLYIFQIYSSSTSRGTPKTRLEDCRHTASRLASQSTCDYVKS